MANTKDEKNRFTRLPFALCKSYGINIEDWWTPRDAWDTLLWKGKINSVEEECKKHAAELKRIEESQKNFKSKNESFEIPEFKEAYEFNRINTRHHIRHVRELGFKNQKEYEREAVRFFNSNEGKLYYSKQRDLFYRYERKTGLFVSVNRYGCVRTFMRISKKDFEKIATKEDVCDA